CTARERCEELVIKQSSGLIREGQEAYQDVRPLQQRRKFRRPREAAHPFNDVARAAPTRTVKTQMPQWVQRGTRQITQAKDPDSTLRCQLQCLRQPLASALLK